LASSVTFQLRQGEEAAPATGLSPAVKATLDRVLQMRVGWQPTFRRAWAFGISFCLRFCRTHCSARPSHSIDPVVWNKGAPVFSQSAHDRIPRRNPWRCEGDGSPSARALCGQLWQIGKSYPLPGRA
jgi:hypothetical protein